MNVLFVFQGVTDTPNYYLHILNRLNSLPDTRLTVAVGWDDLSRVGTGVPLFRSAFGYPFVDLAERKRRDAVLYLPALWRLLLRVRPSVVVVVPEYLESFRVHPLTRLVRRLLGARLILKSIPFRVQTCDEFTADFQRRVAARMQAPPVRIHALLGHLSALPAPFRLAGRLLSGCLKAWRKVNARIAFSRELRRRRSLWRLPDAHVNYIEDAYRVYGSYGVPRERIFIIKNSPDTDRWLAVREQLLRDGVRAHPRRLLHVGRLVAWKRVDLLLQAFAALRGRFPDAELVVAGEGPMEQAWKALAVRLGVQDAVRFVGGVYEASAMGRLFLSSAVYALAGMGGISINDAMCFSRPIVCSVCDGTEKHLVRDGVNGFYFRDGDALDLQAKLERLLADPALAAGMGRRSLEIILTEINIYTVLRAYVEAFGCVTGRDVSRTLDGLDERAAAVAATAGALREAG